MRYYEINEQVLLEYDGDITWQKFGNAITTNTKSDKDTVLDLIQQTDPTTNQRYSQWIAKGLAKDTITLEQLPDLKQQLEIFNKLTTKKLLQSMDTDLNRLNGYDDLERVLQKYENVELKSGKDERKEKSDEIKKMSRFIYSDDSVSIIQPLTYQAAQYYGQQTQWCTAYTESKSAQQYFNAYTPIYVIIPKHPEHNGEKYQISFQGSQAIADERDDAIYMHRFIKRFPTLVNAKGLLQDRIAKYFNIHEQIKIAKATLTATLAELKSMNYFIYPNDRDNRADLVKHNIDLQGITSDFDTDSIVLKKINSKIVGPAYGIYIDAEENKYVLNKAEFTKDSELYRVLTTLLEPLNSSEDESSDISYMANMVEFFDIRKMKSYPSEE
jgi:hypothetical protein